MTKEEYIKQKIELLNDVLKGLYEAEGSLDRLEDLDTANNPNPDHSALGIGDLIDDAICTTEELVKTCEKLIST